MNITESLDIFWAKLKKVFEIKYDYTPENCPMRGAFPGYGFGARYKLCFGMSVDDGDSGPAFTSCHACGYRAHEGVGARTNPLFAAFGERDAWMRHP